MRVSAGTHPPPIPCPVAPARSQPHARAFSARAVRLVPPWAESQGLRPPGPSGARHRGAQSRCTRRKRESQEGPGRHSWDPRTPHVTLVQVTRRTGQSLLGGMILMGVFLLVCENELYGEESEDSVTMLTINEPHRTTATRMYSGVLGWGQLLPAGSQPCPGCLFLPIVLRLNHSRTCQVRVMETNSQGPESRLSPLPYSPGQACFWRPSARAPGTPGPQGCPPREDPEALPPAQLLIPVQSEGAVTSDLGCAWTEMMGLESAFHLSDLGL